MSFFVLSSASRTAVNDLSVDTSSSAPPRQPSRPVKPAAKKAFAYNMASAPDESEFTRF